MENKKSEKKLGRFDIYTLGIGGAIGSGIFVMMGLGIAYTGRSIFLAVALGCMYMLLAYLYQPVMASIFVLPGGDYDMKSMLFNPILTGISGIFTCMGSMALAVYGTAMVSYLGMVIPGIVPYSKIISILVVTLFFASTIKGSKFLSTLNNIMTVVLLAAIALFIVFGLPNVKPGYFGEGFFLNGGVGFIQAISIMSFACGGVTMTPISMMAATKEPRRTIPIMLIFIALTVGVLYGLIGVVAAGVLPIEQVAGQNLSTVASEIFPRWLYVIFIVGGAVFAIATSLLGSIAQIRYPIQRVALDGWLPPIFKKTTKSGYPWVLQLFFYLFTCLPIILDFSLEMVTSLCMIPTMLMNTYLNLALIKLVKKYPKQWETSVYHMPTPVFNTVCVLSSVCALAVACYLATSLTAKEIIGIATLLAVCVIWAVICLKTGAVKKEDLLAKREEIARKALAATEECD